MIRMPWMSMTAQFQERGIAPSNAAFSLVELLMMVCIITVLAAMLLPGIRIVRTQAKAIACASALRQVGMCASAYSQDWNDLLVYAESPKRLKWYELLASYAEVSDKDGAKSSDAEFNNRNILIGCSEYRRNAARLWRIGYGYNHRPLMPVNTTNTLMFSSSMTFGDVSRTRVTHQSTRTMIACSDEWTLGVSTGGPTWNYGAIWGPHGKQRNTLAYDLHVERLHSDDVIRRLYDPSTVQ